MTVTTPSRTRGWTDLTWHGDETTREDVIDLVRLDDAQPGPADIYALPAALNGPSWLVYLAQRLQRHAPADTRKAIVLHILDVIPAGARSDGYADVADRWLHDLFCVARIGLFAQAAEAHGRAWNFQPAIAAARTGTCRTLGDIVALAGASHDAALRRVTTAPAETRDAALRAKVTAAAVDELAKIALWHHDSPHVVLREAEALADRHEITLHWGWLVRQLTHMLAVHALTTAPGQ